ncbi:MAG: YceK/YidQ family lipoprotein [Planctomycetota bacterium]
MTHTRRLLGLALALALGPVGCIIGSPVAAFSGEPWGMTRDDWSALGGRERGPIWGGAPVFAAIDLPFAFVLDTGFLPISGLIWLIRLAADGDDDGGHGHSHGDGEHDHDHDGDGESDHTHVDDEDFVDPTASTHTHADGTTHAHDEPHAPADTRREDLTQPSATPTRGHHHGDFLYRHHHGDGDFDHTHPDKHHHGDGNLNHDHGNGDPNHVHLSDHHHGDYDLDHHHGDGVFDHTHPPGTPKVYPASGN